MSTRKLKKVNLIRREQNKGQGNSGLSPMIGETLMYRRKAAVNKNPRST